MVCDGMRLAKPVGLRGSILVHGALNFLPDFAYIRSAIQESEIHGSFFMSVVVAIVFVFVAVLMSLWSSNPKASSRFSCAMLRKLGSRPPWHNNNLLKRTAD